MARGWLSRADGDGPKLIYDYIYSFHMPLFFIISGALRINGIRDDPRRAILSRVGSIAWPYVLWGIVSILLWPVISQFTLNPMHDFNASAALKGLLLGQSSWFLWTLFLTQCILIAALQIKPELSPNLGDGEGQAAAT
jgi:acyltransferase